MKIIITALLTNLSRNKTKIEQLIDWQVCEISDKIESKEGKYGMGIYATEALEEDEVLLKIEPKDLITVEMLFEQVKGRMAINDYKLDCTDALSLLIALEVRKKEDSQIWPYILNLPEKYDTPLEFWPEEYDQFLMKHVQQMRTTAISDFEIRYERIDEVYNKSNWKDKITPDEFHYAYAAVFTRYFSYNMPENSPAWFRLQTDIDSCGAIAPIFDLMNHNWYATCNWFTDDGMLIKAGGKIEAGQELLIGYGDNTLQNARTVQSYGYTTSDASQIEEKIEFTKDELIQACISRFSLSQKLCELRVDHAMEMANHEMSYVDYNCDMETTVVRYVSSNGVYADDELVDSDPADDQKAREYRLILWILYHRFAEAIQIEKNLEKYNFKDNEKKFENMILDLLNSDKNILVSCIGYLEEEALQLEQFHLEFTDA